MNPQSIECICPIYIDKRGDCTILILNNGTIHIVEKPILSTIKGLFVKKKKEKEEKPSEFDRYLVKTIYINEPNEIEKESEKRVIEDYVDLFVNSKNTVPLIYDGNIFIKVKIRKPRIKNDSAYGYINIRHIDKLESKDNSAFISLSSGFKLKLHSSFDTMYKSVVTARSLNVALNYILGDKTKSKSDNCIQKFYSNRLSLKHCIKNENIIKNRMRNMFK